MALDHGRHHRRNLSFVGDVEPVPVAAPDLARDPQGGVRVDVGHRDVRAGLRQRLRGRPPDAGAAAGDKRHPAVEPQQPEVVGHRRLPARLRASAIARGRLLRAAPALFRQPNCYMLVGRHGVYGGRCVE